MTQISITSCTRTKRLITRFLETTTQRIHAYNEDSAANKTLFHWRGKALLKQIAQDLGYDEGGYDLRSNKGGMAVSGEITLHTDNLYVQFSCSAFGSDLQMMFRCCEHRRDYTGGQNHFLPFQSLRDYQRVLQALRALHPE